MHETEASSSLNPIMSSKQTNISEETPAQESTLDDTLADTFLANPVFEDIAEDTEIQQLREHYLPTLILPPRLRFANMVDPISDPQSAHNNPRPMAPFAEAAGQINQDVFAGLNPDAIQYLLHALNQYARIPGNNLEQLRPQEDLPTNQQAETEGGLKGCAPKPFTGERSRALNFLSDFNTYWISNDNNVSMKVPYQRVALYLGFLKGDKIREWKDDQLRTLQDEIRVGTSCNSKRLWDNFKKSFINSFVDTAVKEYATHEFNRLEQKGNEIEDYIIQFNNLSTRLQHDHNSLLLVERFCKGPNKGTHNDIMNLDIWPESLDEWQEAARRVVCQRAIRQERTGGQGNWNLSTRA